jgi:hypothetical protein
VQRHGVRALRMATINLDTMAERVRGG